MSGCLTRAAPRTIPRTEPPHISANRAVRERSPQRTAWQRRRLSRRGVPRRRYRSERATSRSSSSRRSSKVAISTRITSGSGRSRRPATRRSTSRNASISAGCTTTVLRARARRSRARDWALCCRSTSTTFATPRAPSSASGHGTSCCVTPYLRVTAIRTSGISAPRRSTTSSTRRGCTLITAAPA